MPIQLPKDENGIVQRIDAYVAAITPTPANYQLSAGQVTSITDKLDQVKDDRALVESLRNQLAAATAAKNTHLAELTAEFRTQARFVVNNPNVTQENLGLAGFSGADTEPSPIPPIAPANLSARGTSDGSNHLRWSANGNQPRTTYIIEARIGSATAFAQVGASSTTRFEHKDQQPGVQAIYRVRAQRGSELSGPSNEAIVYPA